MAGKQLQLELLGQAQPARGAERADAVQLPAGPEQPALGSALQREQPQLVHVARRVRLRARVEQQPPPGSGGERRGGGRGDRRDRVLKRLRALLPPTRVGSEDTQAVTRKYSRSSSVENS